MTESRHINRVLLIQPPYTLERDIPKIVEMPLGLCYIAAVLRESGYDVRILDCLAEKYWQEERIDKKHVRCGLSFKEIAEKIKAFKPDVVGVSSIFTIQYLNARKVVELVKKVDKNILTAMGGMHPTVATKDVMDDENLDFVLLGEAEYSFLELLNNLNEGKSVDEIDGLAYRKDGRVVTSEKKKLIETLDELPLPARDLLPIENYFKAGLAHGFILKEKRNMNVVTSRGCPGQCVFCTIHLMWGRKFRARSAESVLDELEHLKKTYNVNHIQFEDDNLTFDKERTKKICQGMIDRKLNLKWNTPNGIAAWTLDKEAIDLMKKAGCYSVTFAVESGDQHVLSHIIKKPQNLEHVTELIKHCRKIGMNVGSFFVVGMPGETREQMQKSFDYPYKVDLNYVQYSIATPFLGTELYKMCEEKNLFAKGFDPSSLYTRRANIVTEDFDPDWLEGKVKREFIRFALHRAVSKPHIFAKSVKEYILVNPKFVIDYLRSFLS